MITKYDLYEDQRYRCKIDTKHYIDCIGNKQVEYGDKCANINFHNDCKNYKQKWWLFWIKTQH
ncbi:MAG: hypothetical protein KAT68_17290 [Bacteroidales bacterium]|nr:hypothetical protein [Bacteroidales bacterium]